MVSVIIVARFSFEPIHRSLRVAAFLYFHRHTPLGCLLRLGGKDLLRLKRSRDARTYWHFSKDSGPMDRLF